MHQAGNTRAVSASLQELVLIPAAESSYDRCRGLIARIIPYAKDESLGRVIYLVYVVELCTSEIMITV